MTTASDSEELLSGDEEDAFDSDMSLQSGEDVGFEFLVQKRTNQNAR